MAFDLGKAATMQEKDHRVGKAMRSGEHMLTSEQTSILVILLAILALVVGWIERRMRKKRKGV